MPSYTITEIDAPWQTRRSTIRIVAQTGEEASDAPDGDADRKRHCVKVTGRSPQSDVTLHELNGNEPSDEGPNDRLAPNQIGRVVQVLESLPRILKPVEKL